jgi:nicotinamidase-related amidase
LRSRLWHELDVDEAADLLVEKTASSAFFPGYCLLPDLLKARDIETILIAGTVTNVCCESSARDAATLGYRVIMVADANSARRDQDHNATLYTIYRTFGDVRTTDEVVGLIEG